jgi:5-methyltetrahydrofolate--homocysteine methyltransferase
MISCSNKTKENTMFDSKAIIDALVGCDEPKVLKLVQNGLDEGIAAKEILNQGLIAGMDVVGEKMENEDMFIPEVLMAAKVMSAAVGILKPLLAAEDMSAMGRVIIGTVKGDLHDIGKNLVAMMLESAGFEVYNLGVDISPDKFVSEVNEKNANMVCLSALLTTTMPMMKQTIDAVVESGLRDRVKIMVGGAPVTKNYANEIGADGYAPDAGSATKLAKALLQ